jgi:hypothetical protein
MKPEKTRKRIRDWIQKGKPFSEWETWLALVLFWLNIKIGFTEI